MGRLPGEVNIEDTRIADSRRGRILGAASRVGGTALLCVSGYVFRHNNPTPDAMAYFMASVIPGVGFLGAGIRLAAERGAAIKRTERAGQLDSQPANTIVARPDHTAIETVGDCSTSSVGDTVATIGTSWIAIGGSVMTGVTIGGGSLTSFEDAIIAGAAAAMTGAEAPFEALGAATDTPPSLYRKLNLA